MKPADTNANAVVEYAYGSRDGRRLLFTVAPRRLALTAPRIPAGLEPHFETTRTLSTD